jgi:hypothetical protein
MCGVCASKTYPWQGGAVQEIHASLNRVLLCKAETTFYNVINRIQKKVNLFLLV